MEPIFVYKSGLSSKPNPDLFAAEVDGTNLILNQIELKVLKNKVLQSYRIPLGNIVECGLVSEEEIISKDKSVIARGLAGGFLFGPAGLVLGGMSGIGSKQKKQRITLFVITYISVNEPGELKSFVLDTNWNNRDLANMKFAKLAAKEADEHPKSQMVKDFLQAHSAPSARSGDTITL